MTTPKISVIIVNGQIKGYRIEGGDIAPGWRPRGTPWCRFSVFGDGLLGSYGGEVWPLAWPELFESTGTAKFPNGTAQCPAGVRLTPAGRVAVDKALRDARMDGK